MGDNFASKRLDMRVKTLCWWPQKDKKWGLCETFFVVYFYVKSEVATRPLIPSLIVKSIYCVTMYYFLWSFNPVCLFSSALLSLCFLKRMLIVQEYSYNKSHSCWSSVEMCLVSSLGCYAYNTYIFFLWMCSGILLVSSSRPCNHRIAPKKILASAKGQKVTGYRDKH